MSTNSARRGLGRLFFLQKLQNVFKINDHNDSGYCYTHISMQFAVFTKLKSKFI
jgi:hypothetical protein